MTKVDLKRLNVLLVDDSRNMLRLMEEILRALGVRNVFSVTDVPDAFREMRVNAIDLAIVDLEMDPMDGLEFVRMLRTANDSPDKCLPVIMLTAHTQMSNVVDARDAGVHEFLAKPVSPRNVYERIISVMMTRRAFVSSSSYSGPDRRRRDKPREGPDRRRGADQADSTKAPKAPVPSDGGESENAPERPN